MPLPEFGAVALEEPGLLLGQGEFPLRGGLLLLADAVRVRTLRAGQPIDQALGTERLEVAPDFLELLTAVTHELAGLRAVSEFLAEL